MGRMKLLDNVINPATGQVEGYCIIKSVLVKSNVKGADYLDFILADAGGEISAKLWDYDPAQHGAYEPDTAIKIRASVNVWKESEQLKIDRIRNLKDGEDAPLSELVPCAPIEPEKMYSELYDTAGAFKNDDLRMLTQYLLREKKEVLLACPAALKLHHAMRAGLLYHTHTMLGAARALLKVYTELYPELDSELVYAGIILHDIAKTGELSVGKLGLATGYSTEGQLIGHISMGVAMVERASAELQIGDEVRVLVEHMLLAHHNLPEYGSPRYPMFPEAELVGEIDLLDSKLFEMFDALCAVPGGGFSERQWALDNRQLYKRANT